MIFLKSRYDFRAYRQCDELNFELFTDSFEEESSQIEIKPKEADQDDVGAWVVKGRNVFLVESVTPEDEQVTLAVVEPLKIFDRDIWYTGDMTTATTTKGFIEALIGQCWTSSSVDVEYRLPYLTIINELDSTAFIKPQPVKDADDDEESNDPITFNVYEYFCMLRDAYKIRFQFSYTTDQLIMQIGKRANLNHNVVFGDGHAILESQSFGGEDTVAKVTVIQKQLDKTTYTAFDYYLTEDGEMSEENDPPAPRVQGRWSVITMTNDPEDGATTEGLEKDRKDEAAREFGENAGGNKIEFWSDEIYELGDVLTMRLNNKIVKGMVSSIKIRSDNKRWFYTTGDLATSLTEKLKKKG